MNRFEQHEAAERSRYVAALVHQGSTKEAAEADLAAKDRLEAASRWLHSKLFREEEDWMGDSHHDLQQRDRGINPMSDDYTAMVNAKRRAYGLSELDASGRAVDGGSWALCENIVSELKQILKNDSPKHRRYR